MHTPSFDNAQNGHMSGLATPGGGGGGGGGGGLWRRPQPPPGAAPGAGAPPYTNGLPADAYPPTPDLLRDFPSARPSNGFSEQLALMRVWCKCWSPAERLVSLTCMMEHLSDTQMTLLRNVVQARLQHKPGLLMKEARANKPEVVYRECTVSPAEQALDFLQDHLPLLALTNHEAKPLYLNGVMRAVRAAMQPGAGPARLEQARQLLGLLAIHPVLTRDDKRVVQGLFAEYTEAANAAEAASVGAPPISLTASPDRRPVGGPSQLFSDQRRHSACAAFGLGGGEGRVPSPGFSPPQPPPPQQPPPDAACWQSRNLLSPVHASDGPLSAAEQQFQQQQRLRSNSLTPPGTLAPPGDAAPGDLLLNKPRSSSIHLDHCPLDGAGEPGAGGGGATGLTSGGGLLTTVNSCGGAAAAHSGGSGGFPGPTQLKKCVGGNYPQRSASQCNLADISRSKDFSVRGSGTTTLPKWLHKLRLHKYTWIFARMTYEELFDVTLERLLALGVTQGGANKLLRNIQELNERAQKLRSLEQGLAENKISLVAALEMMQVLVVSPMRAHKSRLSPAPAPAPAVSGASSGTPVIRVTRSDEPAGGGGGGATVADDADLQALMTRVLAKMCTQLLVAQSADDEAIQTFLWVLDEATWHEAFTDAQRRKFVTWKRQISLELGRRQVFPPPFRRHSDARQYHSQRRHSDVRGHHARRYPGVGARPAVAPHYVAAGATSSGGGGGGAAFPAPSIGYWGGAPAVGPPAPQPAVGGRGGSGRIGGASSLSPSPLGMNFPRRTSLQESVLEVPSPPGGLYRTNSGEICRPGDTYRCGGAGSDVYRLPAAAAPDIYRPASAELQRAGPDGYRPPPAHADGLIYRGGGGGGGGRAAGLYPGHPHPAAAAAAYCTPPPPPPGFGSGRTLHTIPAAAAAAAAPSTAAGGQCESLAATESISRSVCETALK